MARFVGNIQYSLPPFGVHRFLAPQAPHSQLGSDFFGQRDHSVFGPASPQAPVESQSEDSIDGAFDCLTLNVWAPDFARPNDRLPVLFYIPGGGFIRGRASDPLYDPSTFVRHGIVVVTCNYRVGLDGFMHFPDAQGTQVSANRGLLDQIAAFNWIVANIGQYGGDPENITLGGVSAGAGSIAILLGLPQIRGKVKRAILQSPSMSCQTVDEARLAREATARLLNCEPTLSALSVKPLSQVVRAIARLHADYALREELGMSARNFFPVRPVVDGVSITQEPLAQLREVWAQSSVQVPDLLIGANEQEMNFYLVPSGEINRIDDRRVDRFCHAIGWGVDEKKFWCDRLKSSGLAPNAGQLLAAMQSHYYYQKPAFDMAQLARELGAQVWHYEFAWKSKAANGLLGAAHAMELPFVFNNLHLPRAQEFGGPNMPQELADSMNAAWTSFIRGQAPSDWPTGKTRIFE
jgi:para-nitrobenzyl esterase